MYDANDCIMTIIGIYSYRYANDDNVKSMKALCAQYTRLWVFCMYI